MSTGDNPVLADIVTTGKVTLPSGERIPVSSQIDPACGALLQECIARTRPRVAVEVGLAYGISTLYILEAMARHGGERLIGMDPAQNDGFWRGGGLGNVQRAGYGGMYEFHEATSQLTLPALVGRKERVGFGFIDGWHTFDHVLLDFFYIDMMLDVGGIIVLDDVWYPSIHRLAEFLVVNRAYEVAGAVRKELRPNWRQRLKRVVRKATLPLHRTHLTPPPEARARIAQLEDVYFLALRKTAEDTRRWDHFVQF